MNKTNISIKPSRRKKIINIHMGSTRQSETSLSAHLTHTFDNVERRKKLVSIAQIKNIQNDLTAVRKQLKSVSKESFMDWQVSDRAMCALSQTKDAIAELDLIIDHIKQS
jgi:hypothetical protein